MTGDLKQVRDNLSQSLGQLAELLVLIVRSVRFMGCFISFKNLSLSEIAETLGVSKGNVSLNTRLMEQWV